MGNLYTIEFTNEELSELVGEAQGYCSYSKKTKSMGGFDILTLVMTAIQVVTAVLCVPALAEALESGKVTLKRQGIDFVTDKKTNIIKGLMKDEVFRREVTDALSKGELIINGTVRDKAEILKKINEMEEKDERSQRN